MFPGGGSGQYQQGDGWSGPPQPGGDPSQQYPQSYEQPGYGQQPGYGAQPNYGYEQTPVSYQQPVYQQPVYQQPPPAYQQPPPAAYQQPGYGYQQPPAYQPVPVAPRSGVRSHVMVVAAVAILAMLSVVGVAVFLANRSDDPDGPGPNTAGSTSASPNTSGGSGNGSGNGGQTNPEPNPADGLTVGTGGVRVDIYVDYQCPPCSTFEASTGDILSSNISSGKVTLRIHPVAFIDNRSKNKYATRAAAAAVCAYEGGKALEFHSYLLEHQPAEDTEGPTDEDLARAGSGLGLGADFQSCVTGGKRVGWAAKATAAAQDYGVTSVPAAYVDSRKIDATKAALVNAIG